MDEVRRLLIDRGIPSEKNDRKQKDQCRKSIHNGTRLAEE